LDPDGKPPLASAPHGWLALGLDADGDDAGLPPTPATALKSPDRRRFGRSGFFRGTSGFLAGVFVGLSSSSSDLRESPPRERGRLATSTPWSFPVAVGSASTLAPSLSLFSSAFGAFKSSPGESHFRLPTASVKNSLSKGDGKTVTSPQSKAASTPVLL